MEKHFRFVGNALIAMYLFLPIGVFFVSIANTKFDGNRGAIVLSEFYCSLAFIYVLIAGTVFYGVSYLIEFLLRKEKINLDDVIILPVFAWGTCVISYFSDWIDNHLLLTIGVLFVLFCGLSFLGDKIKRKHKSVSQTE